MRGLRRVLAGLGVLVLVVGVGLAVWEPLVAIRVTPPPVHHYDSVIARDRFGVPHIFGKTDPDVAYGVAYAHAEDDFATLQEAVLQRNWPRLSSRPHRPRQGRPYFR